MRDGRWLVGILGLWLMLGAYAEAGEVVLAGGDVLRGEVAKEGDALRLVHADLGTLRIDPANVRSYVVDSAAPTPRPPEGDAAPKLTRTVVRHACPPACAKPAAPKGAAGSAKRPWDFSATLGLSDENGNTDKFAYNIDLEGEYRWGRNRLGARFRSSYEEVRGDQTEGKFHGHLKYARRISRRGELWGLWVTDRDDFADLLLRTGWFAGYRHRFVDTDRTEFAAGAGPGFVVEERVDVARLETAAFIAMLDFEHEFRKGDSFRANYWIIPYFEETQRSPMRLELRYAHPLRDHFDVTASFLLDYVPDPPEPGIKPEDTKFLLGLRWRP